MSAFNPRTLKQWVEGHRRASQKALTVYAPSKAIRLSLALMEAAWPIAQNARNRKLHEEDARSVRALWVRLAKALPQVPKASRKRSRR